MRNLRCKFCKCPPKPLKRVPRPYTYGIHVDTESSSCIQFNFQFNFGSNCSKISIIIQLSRMAKEALCILLVPCSSMFYVAFLGGNFPFLAMMFFSSQPAGCIL